MKLLFVLTFFTGLVYSIEPFPFPEKISDCTFYKQEGRPQNYSQSLPLFLGWYTCKEDYLNSLYIFPIKKEVSFKVFVNKLLKSNYKTKKEGRIKNMSSPHFYQGLQMIEASVASKGAKEEIGYRHQFFYFKVNNKSYILHHTQNEDLFNQHKKQILAKIKEAVSFIKKK